MQKFARILVIAVLAAFAAGSVVHVASATTMSVKMALSDTGAMDMADCEGCGSSGGDGDGGLTCDIVCLAPLLANLSPDGVLAVSPGASPTSPAFYDFVGRTGPPEPYPPRTLI